MDILQYPFDSQLILRTKKKIRRELLTDGRSRIKKKVAILGGSTTAEIRNMLDLFLLDQGIEAEFYESEYNRYWQDVMFDEYPKPVTAPSYRTILRNPGTGFWATGMFRTNTD